MHASFGPALPFRIYYLNESTEVTNDQAAKMVDAFQAQATRDYAVAHNQPVPILEFRPDGQPGPDGEAGILKFQDKDPDEPDAAGFHTEDALGRFVGSILVEPSLANGGTVLGLEEEPARPSVAQTGSHETLELLGDRFVNLWVEIFAGMLLCYELCDPCENDGYFIGGVQVSNFAWPRYFDAQAPKGSRLDQMGTISGPGLMSRGGYQEVRTAKGASEVFARHADVRDGLPPLAVLHRAEPGLVVLRGVNHPDWRLRFRERKHSRGKARRLRTLGQTPLLP